MPMQITNIGSILKKIIIPTIQDQLPKQSVLFDKIKKNSGVTMANNTIYIAARTGRSSGIYSVAEGTEPGTGNSTYSNPYTSIKFTFGTLTISDQAIEAAKDNSKAIASILTTEIKALTSDFRKDINRQFFGDGSGTLCLCNGTGVATTTTLTVDEPGTRYLTPGMSIVIGTSTAVAITSVDSATAVTIPAGPVWANNDTVKKNGAGTTGEMMGLKGLIDDGDYVGTIQNIDRNGNSWAKSQVEDTAATLTEAHMIDLYLAAMEYGKPSVIFMGPNGFSKYGSLLTSMKKTSDLKEILSGGWKGLEFMGGDVGVMLDYDCPENSAQDFMVFAVDFDTFTIAEMTEPFKFMEAEANGGILRRSSGNRTVWESTIKYYANLVCKNHRSNGRLDNKQKG